MESSSYYYVKRGFEEEAAERLRRDGAIALVGPPGVGKSATALYIAQLVSQSRAVVISPSMTKKPRIGLATFYDEVRRPYLYPRVYLPADLMDPDLAPTVARAIADALAKVDDEKLAELKEKVRKVLNLSAASKLDGMLGDLFKEVLPLQWRDLEDSLAWALAASTIIVSGVVNAEKLAHYQADRPHFEGTFIFDDLADFGRRMNDVATFGGHLRLYGGRVIYVKRIEYTEYEDLVEMAHGNALHTYQLRAAALTKFFRGIIDDERNIYTMDVATPEEFEKLLRANLPEYEKVKEEYGDLLYRASAGSIAVALNMVRMGLTRKELEKIEAKRGAAYTPNPRNKNDVKKNAEHIKMILKIIHDKIGEDKLRPSGVKV